MSMLPGHSFPLPVPLSSPPAEDFAQSASQPSLLLPGQRQPTEGKA